MRLATTSIADLIEESVHVLKRHATNRAAAIEDASIRAGHYVWKILESDPVEMYHRAKGYLSSPKHLIDSTAMVVSTFPVYAAIETEVAKTSDETSMMSRTIALGIVYGGIGGLFDRGRMALQRKVEEYLGSPLGKAVRTTCDCVYTAGLVAVTTPIQLLLSRATSEQWMAAVPPTAVAAVASMFILPPAIDAAEELAGVSEKAYMRLPRRIREGSRALRCGVAGTAISLSLYALTFVYGRTPDTVDPKEFWEPIPTISEFVQRNHHL